MYSVNLKSVCKANKSSRGEGLPYKNDEGGVGHFTHLGGKTSFPIFVGLS